MTAPSETTAWWRHAVIYQVYPRSFADSDGDGMGDLPGITSRLPYVRDLGVDGVWISPCYRSPQVDAGYDVADYQDIDPIFGTLADADELIRVAHELGLRVIVDVVPNHTSDEHRWFVQALQSPPGSQARDRYIFRDGTGPGGDRPPNNWPSVFGGEAWTRVTEADGTPGQWYLHLFHAKQPDLNWQNPGRRCGTKTRCTRSTGAGARYWTATTGTACWWRRPGWIRRGWRGTYARTSCTRHSISAS